MQNVLRKTSVPNIASCEFTRLKMFDKSFRTILDFYLIYNLLVQVLPIVII